MGRVIGDFYLSAAAFHGMDKVINLTFEPMGVMVVLSIGIALLNYSQLQPRYEDEDDEEEEDNEDELESYDDNDNDDELDR